MAKLLILASRGPEDPTQITLPFHLAKAAREAGQEVAVILAADASPVANPKIREHITGVGFPPLSELYAFMQRSNVPVYL